MDSNSENIDQNFENINFNPFLNKNILLNNNGDPDCNFFDEYCLTNTPYLNCDEVKTTLNSQDDFSIIHVNLRSMSKNFENFKTLLANCSHEFSMICITETWCKDDAIKFNSNYQLPNYNVVHFPRKNRTGGGICVFVHNSLIFKLRDDLSTSDENNESMIIEIINKNSKNIIIGTTYRPPSGKIKPFKSYFKNLFEKSNQTNKVMYFLGDFNLNVLNYDTDSKVKNFFNMIFKYGMISIINKPTRVTPRSITAIDHIFTNNFCNANLKTGIIKSDLSDHFPIYVTSNKIHNSSYPQNKIFFKRIINNDKINTFKDKLQKLNWKPILKLEEPNAQQTSLLEDLERGELEKKVK